MNNRRKEILKELGLTPIWRIKSNDQQYHVPSQMHSVKKKRNKDQKIAISIDQERCSEIQQMNWSQLKASVTHCTACPLSHTRVHTVFGIGDGNADWLYVGEGPGEKEDATGEPFVGQAGELLDNMLAAIGLKRGYRVYITNIVKCHPPNNRNPDLNEVSQCEPYLERQIALINPKLIIALGKIAAQSLLKCNESVSNLRGTLYEYSGIPLIVTYHPAYLLRAPSKKEKTWEDLCFAKATMQSL